MTDVFTRKKRSEIMSHIRSKGNKSTEILLATLLRSNKLHGWRRHQPLPGKPDFAWPKAKVAVFVDGCFWHSHNCGKGYKPISNSQYWTNKFLANRQRDIKCARALRLKGWSVIRIWECALAKSPQTCISRIRRKLLVNSHST